jgi:RNA polymerase sigma factor (sigma-70 family)
MEALSILYERHKDALYTYCIHLGVSDNDARDAVQDVFLRIHGKVSLLADGLSFRPWVLSIARNMIYNGKRNSHLIFGEIPDVESPEDDPLALTVRLNDTAALWSCIDRLDPATREVILLRIEQDLSYREIASILGVTEESVRTRLYRARKSLIRDLHLHGGYGK